MTYTNSTGQSNLPHRGRTPVHLLAFGDSKLLMCLNRAEVNGPLEATAQDLARALAMFGLRQGTHFILYAHDANRNPQAVNGYPDQIYSAALDTSPTQLFRFLSHTPPFRPRVSDDVSLKFPTEAEFATIAAMQRPKNFQAMLPPVTAGMPYSTSMNPFRNPVISK